MKKSNEHFESKKQTIHFIIDLSACVSRFEEIASSIDQIEEEEQDGEDADEPTGDNISSNGTIRSTKNKKLPKEHVNINSETEV